MSYNYDKIKTLPDNILRKRSIIFTILTTLSLIGLLGLFLVIFLVFAMAAGGHADFSTVIVLAIVFEILLFALIFYLSPTSNICSREINIRNNPEFVLVLRFNKINTYENSDLQLSFKHSIIVLILSLIFYFSFIGFSVWGWLNIYNNILLASIITSSISLILIVFIGYYSLPYFLVILRERKKRN